jgi:hypothetical protein
MLTTGVLVGMHFIAAITGMVALMTLIGNRRLRVHSISVLISAAAWAAVNFLFLPLEAAPNWGSIASGVVDDCCGMSLAGYHLLLSLALFLGIIREGLWLRGKP